MQVLYQHLIQHPLLFPIHDLLPWCCWVSLPGPCSFWPFTWTSQLFTTTKQNQKSKRCHQARASSRLEGPFLVAFYQVHSCNRLVPGHKAAVTPPRNSSLTQGHMQANAGQQTPNKHFGCTLIPPPHHVYDALKLIQIISVPHPPMDSSPNPFRERMWLQSNSTISSSVAKLYAIEQPNISTLSVILLLQHCKRKNERVLFGFGFFLLLLFFGFCFLLFFYDGAATVWRKPVFCTHKGTHVFHMVHCKLHRIESSWRKTVIEKWFSWASSVDLFCL